MTHDTAARRWLRWLDGLEEVRAGFNWIAANYANLRDDELLEAAVTVNEFLNSLESTLNYLAVLRMQRNA